DGIRDPLVTGVQTCALPIAAASGRNEESVVGCRRRCRTGFSKLHKVLGPDAQSAGDAKWVWQHPCLILLREKTVHRIGAIAGSQIGRASCRHGLEIAVDNVS